MVEGEKGDISSIYCDGKFPKYKFIQKKTRKIV
jgi:hypothetical protein